MAPCLEVAKPLDVLVQLTVSHFGDAAVLVVDGLVAAGDVDDGEAAHAEHRVVGFEPPFAVGAAMTQAPKGDAHALDRKLPPQPDDARDAAHSPDSLTEGVQQGCQPRRGHLKTIVAFD